MYIRWYGDNIWLFVPVQQKLRASLRVAGPGSKPGSFNTRTSDGGGHRLGTGFPSTGICE